MKLIAVALLLSVAGPPAATQLGTTTFGLAAGGGSGEGQNEHPEEIQAALDTQQCATQRKDEGAEQIERQDEQFHRPPT